ncbi:Uncharacterised protein [Salmonella enterica subsp. enterica serovar Bovismorbificans]|uniref:Uncharacterized protein n=1 Tax=Salmonella enterica subsp. enterica serovar Bovismorbificans TaxID=58097 RepID=A0A655DMH4_SALET|nr:Uncharacterised protein [Salmonella enterica subsp. enterica serovar Bovismorbificans]
MLFPLRVGALRAVHDNKVRFEAYQLFVRWTNEHIFNEVGLPGDFRNKAHGKTRIGICAAERINNE